jgi:biotin carboxylase
MISPLISPRGKGDAVARRFPRRVVSQDVPVSRGVLVTQIEDEARLKTPHYPVLVKPNDEGSSKGIRENAVALDLAGAIARCRWL